MSRSKNAVFLLGLCALVFVLAPAASAGARVGDPYSLDTCPVSGGKLGSMGDPVIEVIDGREVRFCCGGCPAKFKGDPALQAKLDEQLIAAQTAVYPLGACPNSGADLKGGGVAFVVGNRLVKTCCSNCKAAIQKDPTAALAKLDEAVIAKQNESYAAKKCPVSDEDLGSMGEPVNVVIGNQLVKLCCAGCKKGVEKDPAKVLAALKAPAAEATKKN